MTPGGRGDPRFSDRRRQPRVQLSVPVRFGTGAAGKAGGLCPHEGLTTNLSTRGAYMTTREAGPFAHGEILTVSIPIPWESRGLFPFSCIVGRCRVVRVEEVYPASQDTQQGVALAFCGDVSLLAAIVRP
jgi:hypothetical protein